MNFEETTGNDNMPTLEDVSAEQSVKVPQKSRKKNTVAITSLSLTVVMAVLGVFWWLHTSGREETENAYVEGHISYVSSRISGTVTRVLVEEHQAVKKGQLLVVLDPRDQQAKLEESMGLLEQAQKQSVAAKSKINQTALSAQGETSQAQGTMSAMQADIAAARSAAMEAQDQVIEAQSKLKELRAQEEYARADFERYKTVYANRAVTKQQFDKANQNLQVAIAQREQAEQNVRQSKKQQFQAEAKVQQGVANLARSKGMLTSAQAMSAQKPVDEAQYLGTIASVKHYQAAVDQAQLALSYTKLQAPVAGRIGRKSVELGQRVEPGQSLMSIVQEDVWIMANFKETQVGRMRVGQPVEIKIDTFSGRTFKGTVDSIGPASGAKFSMLPPDNATGNFTKIVQRIPVKILFDKGSLGEYRQRVAPGMSCLVTVLVKE